MVVRDDMEKWKEYSAKKKRGWKEERRGEAQKATSIHTLSLSRGNAAPHIKHTWKTLKKYRRREQLLETLSERRRGRTAMDNEHEERVDTLNCCTTTKTRDESRGENQREEKRERKERKEKQREREKQRELYGRSWRNTEEESKYWRLCLKGG